MKKNNYLAIATFAILALGSFTCCHDEDFGVSAPVLQQRAFEQSFIKEFGKPSPDQTWDFYAQQMDAIRSNAGTTRAKQAITVTTVNVNQPDDADFKALCDSWWDSLEEGNNNAHVGQNNYTLTSTGPFNIYAVNYGGGIETEAPRELDFGLVYIDPDDNSPHEVPLFGTGFKNGFKPTYKSWAGATENDCGNPGWGKRVTIPAGVRFYFYLRHTCLFGTGWNNDGSWQTTDTREQIFYSNQAPVFIDHDGNQMDYSFYNGRPYEGNSTLLYTTERIDEATGKDEQIMMIGFEDAWGLDGTNYTPNYLDLDFNDIVLIIDGELPVSDTKRFFIEDKSAFDWDYNDVVFDVSNTGIVLRAVGGTLPVWLGVTDKRGVTTWTEELHNLLASKQHQTIHQDHKLYYEAEVKENGTLVTKKFYKPIDVAANPGLWLDAEPIVRWTNSEGTRLGINANGEDEVALFANPFAANPIGNIQLLVGSYYEQPFSEAQELYALSNESSIEKLDFDDYQNRPRLVRLANAGGIPAIWSATTNVRWMQEFKKITLGYKNFYGKGEKVNGFPQWWKTNVDDTYWYQFVGDHDPDNPNPDDSNP